MRRIAFTRALDYSPARLESSRRSAKTAWVVQCAVGMKLTHPRLRPILESITELLSTDGALQRFEAWAMTSAAALHRSAALGVSCLAQEAAALRDELEQLNRAPAPFTAEASRLRLCQQLWLTGLADFVDELLLDEQTQEVHPWPTNSGPPTHDDLELRLGSEGGLVEVAETFAGRKPYRLERVVESRG